MAYDEDLADRLRVATQHEPSLTEKRMFGGISFLADGNLAVCASSQGDLMVRVDPDEVDGLLDAPRVARMQMGARLMKGWVRVSLESVESDAELQRWVDRGLAFARSLPAK